MGMLSRGSVVLALVLSGAVAMVVGGTAATGARVVPCTQTFGLRDSGPGQYPGSQTFSASVGWDAWSQPGARVTDVDVHFFMQVSSTYEPVDLEVWFRHDGYSQGPLIHRQPVPVGGYDLTFDDEAREGWSANQSSGGDYRPDAPLSDFDRQDARGTWTLELTNAGRGYVFPNDMWVRITTDSCDSDGDGVLENVDNCPAVANPDQVDWDRDGAGNACDPSPGTDPSAPPPPPAPTTQPTTTTPATTTTTAPAPPSTSGCSAGCGYARTVGLAHRKRKHRLTGKVASVAEGCRASVPVSIWKKRSGADRKLVVVTTRDSGTFRTTAPRKPGRYYATVGSASEPLCGEARSRTVRVRR